jgi:hypothetical protein
VVGDPTEVHKTLAIIGGLPTLAITDDANALAQAIIAAGILPPQVVRDAAHVAEGRLKLTFRKKTRTRCLGGPAPRFEVRGSCRILPDAFVGARFSQKNPAKTRSVLLA